VADVAASFQLAAFGHLTQRLDKLLDVGGAPLGSLCVCVCACVWRSVTRACAVAEAVVMRGMGC
jgi:hypothetical protein